MALAATPLRSLKNGEGTAGITVEIAGVACSPGELLFADEDGVLVIDAGAFDTGDRS